MEIICRDDLNAIFWRNSHRDEWNSADLDEMVRAYEDEPYTELEYEETVYREGTDKALFYVFRCKACDKLVLTLDINHEYEFCPHCGRAVI